MKKLKIIHVEIGVEYYKDGSLYTPTTNEKMMWHIFGMPAEIEKLEQTFETEIATISGTTKKSVESIFNENVKNGLYDFVGRGAILDFRW